MAQILAENSDLGQDLDRLAVREIHIDGDILSSDGNGKIMYDGADGSHAGIFPDCFATYEGLEGSGVSGEMNADGSGFWTSADGSASSWDAGEITIDKLIGMERLSNLDSIVNSSEAEEAFGEQGIFQAEGSQFGHLHGFLLKQA